MLSLVLRSLYIFLGDHIEKTAFARHFLQSSTRTCTVYLPIYLCTCVVHTSTVHISVPIPGGETSNDLLPEGFVFRQVTSAISGILLQSGQ
jgi:hypothetical protein